MVREAAFRDITPMVNYIERIHGELGKRVKFDRDSAAKVLSVCVSNKKLHNAWLAETDDGEVGGVLIGITNQLWYSKEKEALDLMFYVSEECRGSGAYMARLFMKWAQQTPGVREIYLSETLGPNDRTHRMYERMGLKHSGHIFLSEVSHV